ncbi:hypothetical protein [Cyclobacterium sp. SYSU L10401]|uniref:hypothetical protein n=1 Tax=Cyclobacterium sp. SYSU L10401 TaxID=2678657 RepID=UPI0013D1F241|nr:hypothetical protein [Cyclobacterium sp. SYSU L10401]
MATYSKAQLENLKELLENFPSVYRLREEKAKAIENLKKSDNGPKPILKPKGDLYFEGKAANATFLEEKIQKASEGHNDKINQQCRLECAEFDFVLDMLNDVDAANLLENGVDHEIDRLELNRHLKTKFDVAPEKQISERSKLEKEGLIDPLEQRLSSIPEKTDNSFRDNSKDITHRE